MCRLRYDEGKPVCPYCGSLNTLGLPKQKKFMCREKECRKQFSIKKGTLMEDSALPLTKWLPALWLVANDKNGISSCELARALRISQKSAWFVLMRCRVAMRQGSLMKMEGSATIEIDETFVGGRPKNMRAAKRNTLVKNRKATGHLTTVLGMMERGGKVRAMVVDNQRRHNLLPEIKKHVPEGATVYTDALRSYDTLKDHGYNHSTIDHSKEFVNGDIHTNTMENFWCLFKRAVKGTYVHISPEHTDLYLDEEIFRYNERKDNDAGRFDKVLAQVFDRRLTWKELTAAEPQS